MRRSEEELHAGVRDAGYQIYEKVVNFANLFVDEDDRPEYLTSVWLYILGPIIGGVLAA
jgi:glycerol uptake facilitator-like aquaporin